MGSYRVMDLFCGTGGFSKGFENTGRYRVVFGLDLLKTSVRTFALNHREALAVADDIRALPPAEVAARIGIVRGELDVLIGGPPCQGFSSIRPHRSSEREDGRNSLFREFADYVSYFRPGVFVLENVVGLATYSGGETIEAMQEAFAKIGYAVDWRIVNAAHFGVPQKRERLIMLGTALGIPLSFPEPTHLDNSDTIGLQDKAKMLLPAQRSLFDLEAAPLPPAVTVMEAIGDLPPVSSGEAATAYKASPQNVYQRARRRRSHELTLHSSTVHGEKMLEIIRHAGPNISCIPKHLITSGFSSCYSRVAADEPSVTITVNFVHPASNRCIHPTQDRALTPREGARLQGFDDDFAFAGTRTEIVKQIGNAVPPLLGQVIAEHVARLLSGETRSAHLLQDKPVAVGKAK